MIELLLIFFTLAHADPIAFSCNESGALTQVIFPPSMIERQDRYVRKLVEKKSTEGGVCNDCVKECGGFNTQLDPVVAQLIEKNMAPSKDPFLKVKESTFEALKGVTERFQAKQLCEKRQLKIEDYLFNEAIVTFYPYHTNWMFVMGCKSVNAKDCHSLKFKELELAINEAVTMGLDPYALIAKSLLEVGTSGPSSLYLDPVGAMDSMGCRGSSVSKNKKGEALNSYGTFYKFNGQMVKNEILGSQLKKLLNYRGVKVDEKPSYLCRKVLSATGEISAKPLQESCCLQIPFTANSRAAELGVNRGLVYEQIKKGLSKKFGNKNDPAFRLQRFNGYTNLMGGAESVQVFRMGLDYYKNPAYGYQGMDFILNSLMINPVLSDLVKKAIEKNGSFKSLLCSEAGAGKFFVDSDYYFKKHRDAERLAVIKEKVDKGETLSSRENSVLEKEIRSPEVSQLLYGDSNYFSPGERVSKLMDKLDDLGVHIEASKPYTTDELLNYYKDVYKMNISADDVSSLREKYEEYLKIKSMEFDEDPWDTLQVKFRAEMNALLRDASKKLKIENFEDRTFSSKQYEVEVSSARGVEKLKDSLSEEMKSRHANILARIDEAVLHKKKLSQNTDALNVKSEEIAAILKKYKPDMSDDFAPQFHELSDRKEILKNSGVTDAQLKHPQIGPLLKQYLNLPATGYEKKVEVEDKKRYFSEVYPLRNTVSKASDFSWKPFTEEQLNSIAKNFEAANK